MMINELTTAFEAMEAAVLGGGAVPGKLSGTVPCCTDGTAAPGVHCACSEPLI